MIHTYRETPVERFACKAEQIWCTFASNRSCDECEASQEHVDSMVLGLFWVPNFHKTYIIMLHMSH